MGASDGHVGNPITYLLQIFRETEFCPHRFVVGEGFL